MPRAPRVLCFADANWLGHTLRLLEVARSLAALGMQVEFAARGAFGGRIEEAGFRLHRLPGRQDFGRPTVLRPAGKRHQPPRVPGGRLPGTPRRGLQRQRLLPARRQLMPAFRATEFLHGGRASWATVVDPAGQQVFVSNGEDDSVAVVWTERFWPEARAER